MPLHWKLPRHVDRCDPCFGIGQIRVKSIYVTCPCCKGSGLVVDWDRLLAEMKL